MPTGDEPAAAIASAGLEPPTDNQPAPGEASGSSPESEPAGHAPLVGTDRSASDVPATPVLRSVQRAPAQHDDPSVGPRVPDHRPRPAVAHSSASTSPPPVDRTAVQRAVAETPSPALRTAAPTIHAVAPTEGALPEIPARAVPVVADRDVLPDPASAAPDPAHEHTSEALTALVGSHSLPVFDPSGALETHETAEQSTSPETPAQADVQRRAVGPDEAQPVPVAAEASRAVASVSPVGGITSTARLLWPVETPRQPEVSLSTDARPLTGWADEAPLLQRSPGPQVQPVTFPSAPAPPTSRRPRGTTSMPTTQAESGAPLGRETGPARVDVDLGPSRAPQVFQGQPSSLVDLQAMSASSVQRVRTADASAQHTPYPGAPSTVMVTPPQNAARAAPRPSTPFDVQRVVSGDPPRPAPGPASSAGASSHQFAPPDADSAPTGFTETPLTTSAASVVQRQSTDASATMGGEAATDGSAEANDMAVGGGIETAAGTGGPATAGASSTQVDELARRLYEPLAASLRAELWLDRERAGRSMTR